MKLGKTVWIVVASLMVVIMPACQGAPKTRPASTTRASSLPTAAQLGAQLKALRDEKANRAQIAHIELARPLQERPADFALMGDVTAPTHYSVLRRLHEAISDRKIAGVLVTIHNDELELAHAQEIRDALTAVSAAGKPTFVYADRFTMASYTVATGAQTICILPGGETLMPGVSLETIFARGLLDKLGVQADMVQIGEYKGASEAFTRTSASDELRGELDRVVDSLYGQLVSDISQRRHLSKRSVVEAIDKAWLPASGAKSAGLIDAVVDIDGLRELIASRVGSKIDLVSDYGIEKQEDLDLSNPFSLLKLLTRRSAASTNPCVALIYVDGMIVEGSGGDSLFADSLAADGPIRKAMRMVSRDSGIKAAVIRINSPGGSALASEAVWQAIRRTAREKPVFVSIGGMAASGGYYIACAGDRIYADPSAIVGSIGVVGGKLSLAGLYKKIGLSTETFSRGANAALFSSSEPFTDAQRKMVSQLMTQTYDQFVDRVMQTRKGRIADIDKVARGRIFVGRQARELGMVDEIGGIEKALADAARKGGLGEDFDVRVLPAPKTLADLFAGNEQAATAFRPQTSAWPAELTVLPQNVRQLAAMQLSSLQLIHQQRVALVAPVMLRIK